LASDISLNDVGAAMWTDNEVSQAGLPAMRFHRKVDVTGLGH